MLRLAERITEGEINAEQVTVADRMGILLRRHRRDFSSPNSLSQHNIDLVVATFLAVLELTRLGKLRIQQDCALRISAAPPVPTSLRQSIQQRVTRHEEPNPAPNNAQLLGIGLDHSDGHKRITRAERFAIVGGSRETHERMTETVMKTFERLDQRGKGLDEVEPKELADLIREIRQ